MVVQSFRVVDDNNDDGSVNKNETIRLNIQLRNAGTSRALSVDGTLSTSDAYVTISDASASFSSVSAGESAWAGSYETAWSYVFALNGTVPTGKVIAFDIESLLAGSFDSGAPALVSPGRAWR